MDRNRKILCDVLSVFFFVLLLGGCEPDNSSADPETPAGEQTASPAFEVVTDAEQLPAEIKGIVNVIKNKRGYYVFNPEQYTTGEDVYILISSGEKPCGGHSLTLNRCTFEDDTLEIMVEEKEPAAGEGVIQVITFPHLILKMNDSYQGYHIINDENENFTAIPATEVPEIIEKKGIYIGQIDNNFIEIEVGGQPQAFMFEQELSLFVTETLNTGDEISFSCYENNYGQLFIISFKTGL